jgi:uncharacterized protein (DUF1015 family)
MSLIHPFRAWRPAPDHAAAVASVPYDVVSTEEARALAQGKPLSFLHVVRPEIDLGPEIDVHDDRVYARGRENLDRFLRDVPFQEEAEPSLYVYRLGYQGREQTGVVACCSVDEYDGDLIRKHEKTRPDKEDDRTRHVVEMAAHAEPIFLACRDHAGIEARVAEVVAGPPLYDFTAEDGVQHTVWRVPAPAGLVSAFASVPCLYIADGHHRAASASRARDHFRKANPRHDGTEEYNRVLATVFPAGQLRILPYNRAVTDLGGLSPEAFRAALERLGPLAADAPPSPESRGAFRVCLREAPGPRWYGFRLQPAPGAGVIESLDVSLLQDRVLAPLLGIEDPRTSKRIEFVGGIRGTAELERLVREGKAAAAFSLYPTSLDELMAVSDAGQIMPPKSTWFEPKLRSGLVVHRI